MKNEDRTDIIVINVTPLQGNLKMGQCENICFFTHFLNGCHFVLQCVFMNVSIKYVVPLVLSTLNENHFTFPFVVILSFKIKTQTRALLMKEHNPLFFSQKKIIIIETRETGIKLSHTKIKMSVWKMYSYIPELQLLRFVEILTVLYQLEYKPGRSVFALITIVFVMVIGLRGVQFRE